MPSEATVAFGDRFPRIVDAELTDMVLPSILERITITLLGMETGAASAAPS